MRLTLVSTLLCLLMPVLLHSQNNAQYREYKSEYVTYPYSDPNPIPTFGKNYPYFKYDGFTTKSEKKEWKIVELENDFLKIKIFPEIGGKIWSVIDKISGKEMFYGNEVVKFRDVALRGPWTSGGFEYNYGVIGHSPACSFPVDYLIRTNADGSISCIVSTLDLLTRTYWSVEINLPKDKAWFTTHSFWHNKTGASKPYYHWINTGVKSTDDLQFIYDGTHYIGHEGVPYPWPMDSARNKNLSHLAENNFGRSKSYHVIGKHSPYFGAYWQNEDFGVLQYSNRDDKLGRKIWIWALSDEGQIWEDYLTDNNGQYIEMQSGRLFNQNMVVSSLTPFKQIIFNPYATDSWKEYWFPFRNTGGVSNVSTTGVIHVKDENNSINIRISPLQTLQDTLKLFDGENNLIYRQNTKLQIGQTFESKINIPADKKTCKIIFGNDLLWSSEPKSLSRPLEKVKGFDWETAYGKYLRGRDYMGFRLYDFAEQNIRKSLSMDDQFIPALVEMSRLYYYHMDYDSAFITSAKALAIDTYDAAANYEYGRSAMKLNRYFDALDGFEVAALTEAYRSAAYTEISKIYLIKEDYIKALEYAEKSLINNGYNIEGLQLCFLANTLLQRSEEAAIFAKKIAELEPLNHFVRFEQYYDTKSSQSLSEFRDNIRNELPQQTYLELGVWYYSLNMIDRSQTLLQLAPENAEISYWLAYLASKSQKEDQAAHLLEKAASQNPHYVFPFREESEDVFEWAIQNQPNWQPRYYLALLHSSRNNIANADELLSSIHEDIEFAPFYIIRSRVSKDISSQEADIKKAIFLSPNEWRYIHELTRFYLNNQEEKKALETISPFYKKNQDHFHTALLFTRVLMRNNNYKQAEKALKGIHVLPSEGNRDGQRLHRQTKLMLAIEALSKNNIKLAKQKIFEAQLWPRNLGAGKPYEENIDSRVEDWLTALIAQKTKDVDTKNEYLKKVATAKRDTSSKDYILQAMAYYQLGEKQLADKMFNSWFGVQRESNVKDWGKSFYNTYKNAEYPFDYEQTKEIVESIARFEFVRLF
ncbi:MAG: Anaphase-promoting complex, cyclosome, subunit 3 [Bacteroidetes bacterium ADurb.Bin174]|nr:MAG: Anaphase-promoting complex, cyclosome, subunit 3 [Bacteroidetes bacterium ADurb.Bin174]